MRPFVFIGSLLNANQIKCVGADTFRDLSSLTLL